MYFYDLHCHTSASHDSDTPIRELARKAKERGLHGIAITDHDVVYRGETELEGVQLMPGVEVTLEDGTHLLAYFVTQVTPGCGLQETVEEIHAQGGLAFLAHPTRRGQGWFVQSERSGEELLEALSLVDGVEGENAKDSPNQKQSNRDFCKTNDGLIQGRVAGSDAHLADQVGYVVVKTNKPLRAQTMREIILRSQIVIRPERGASQASANCWREAGVCIAKMTGLYYHAGIRNALYKGFTRWSRWRASRKQFHHNSEENL